VNEQHRGRQTKDGIRIYDPSDFAGMHAAGKLAATILDEIAEHVIVGQTTAELDRIIEDGWFGDTSRMYVAGKLARKSERLIEVTHDSLMRGISVVKPGNTFGDIGHAIQTFVEGHRMSVVTDFCGHGLGRVFHSPPNVLHYGKPGAGAVLEPGMFFTIEPMVNLGRPETKTLSDEWTAVTRDKSLSAQFEHSVGVTEDGVEIFTLSPAGTFHPTYG
jgi:methionyl aminopeptidase